MLHILLSSPFQISINSLKIFSRVSDELLCIQDGVILGLKDNILREKIEKFFKKVYFLQEDLKTRGLLKFVFFDIKIINFLEFVTLTEKHKINMTW
ncbi:sulfurtransferase complex subunit TusB [Buchnera aphidicola]|uniref:sulfurtransferase complex subunit TusB n=1 Tax=Buchnera aphidicola TaxID=9 RepID=UPI0031B6C3F4